MLFLFTQWLYVLTNTNRDRMTGAKQPRPLSKPHIPNVINSDPLVDVLHIISVYNFNFNIN